VIAYMLASIGEAAFDGRSRWEPWRSAVIFRLCFAGSLISIVQRLSRSSLATRFAKPNPPSGYVPSPSVNFQ